MANCPRCQAQLPEGETQCPRCGPTPTVMRLPGRHQKPSDERVSFSVSAPIHRQRSLQRSCLVGILLFLPTIIFVVILFHYYYKTLARDEQPESQPSIELQPQTSVKSQGEERLAKLREIQTESNLHVIERFKVKHNVILIIGVNERWNPLVDSNKRQLVEQWIKQWNELGGQLVEVRWAKSNQEAVKINALTGEIRIEPTE